jgi:hypothetical protein
MGYATRSVAWLLVLCGIGSSSIAVVTTVQAARIAGTWKARQAIVNDLSAEQLGKNKFAFITISFRYSAAQGDRVAWAHLSCLPSEGESLARRYVVGSRHRIRVDPNDPAKAEVDVGWNVQFLFLPLVTTSASILLFLAAYYFWKRGANWG